jgi:hypothetical protein
MELPMRNNVLLTAACMMMFFRNIEDDFGFFQFRDKVLDLLEDYEFEMIQDAVRNVHEELYS